jgi:hypothetical protein
VWGEPYDKSCIIQHIVEILAPFSSAWPPKDYYMNDGRGELNVSWIANLYPNPDHLVAGVYALFDELFEKPSKARGFDSWGIKEVRLGYNEVVTLNFLYPKAKFVLIHRELESAYSSYIAFAKRARYYSAWPHKMVSTPFQFAKFHTRLFGDFLRLEAEGFGKLVSYEDIIANPEGLATLEEYIARPINYEALHSIVDNSRNKTSVSKVERLLLQIGRQAAPAR